MGENEWEFLAYLAGFVICSALIVRGAARYQTPICPECKDSARTTRLGFRRAHCKMHGNFPVRARRLRA